MKKTILFCLVMTVTLPLFSQWEAAGDRIMTSWGEELDPENVWDAYPRPVMERIEWKNLNGLWDYSISPVNQPVPGTHSGKILVPFPVESSLSGVKKEVGAENVVWYERTFNIPPEWDGRDILLHFGAVDWEADIWINGIKVGSHRGGYDPFYFNISPFIKSGESQNLLVRVWDPGDEGYQPRGKQVSEPGSIWYTSVTGIWQTVWLEPVSKTYIERLKPAPDIDRELLNLKVLTSDPARGDYYEVRVFEGARMIASQKASVGTDVDIRIPGPNLWSPESPFLYDMEVLLIRDEEVIDRVSSYFAMRKISYARDDHGIMRLQLNNEDYFPLGTLDQGWWPDGLYTAPSDEALLYDIQKTKELGFNLIRKHVKVEPARWYTHCDREGILVWQDMPSGDATPVWQMWQYFDGKELERSRESEENFRNEWKNIIDFLYPHPSIVTWIPFNEAWGQFKTEEITEWTKQYDPTRLVIPASGGNHFRTGDMLAIHHYPNPRLYLYDAERPTVLSEFGGIGLALEGHLWEPERNWGYIRFSSKQEVTEQYLEYAGELIRLINAGISGAVYTQITDVEIEVNGLMTYDRKRLKVDGDRIRQINIDIRSTLK